MTIVIWLVNLAVEAVTILVVVHVILSYFLPPYHALRQALNRLVEPMLTPIRRVVRPAGMIDFSPLILLLLVQLLGIIVTTLLRTLL